MSIQTRREREQAERERLIVRAARELAEAEGWGAVTTRRLAEEIDYSQPVLYSHFKSKHAIKAAVAVDGCGELAAELRAAREAAKKPRAALAAVATAYAAFGDRRPALYDAIFSHAVDLPFGTPEAPDTLQAAFGELREAVRPMAGDDNVDVLAETFWSGLHGLHTLMRDGRLHRSDHDRRVALFIDRFMA